MIIGGEKRTKGTVYETRHQNLIVAGFAFALGESAGETACGAVLFTIVHLQRHEIGSRNCIFGCTNSCEQYGVAHAEHGSAIGLFCNLSGLNCDGSSIRQLNCLGNYVHLKIEKITYCFDLHHKNFGKVTIK